MNVALYARVSKDICRTCGKNEAAHDVAAGESTGHDFRGQDPEAQLQPLREMCRARGWTIVQEYVDQGWSGAQISRPALDALMGAVDGIDSKKLATRSFEGILVWKWDRLFRSTQHMLKAFETFQRKKLEFISLTEQIDTSTPAGKLMFGIFALIAEFERSLIGERIRNGMKKKGAKKSGPKIGEKGPSASTRWRRAKRQNIGG